MNFEEFAAARLPTLLRFAAVLTGDHALAEDVVQEVLIRVSSRWEQISGLDRPERYVRKMVTNEFLSSRRRSGRVVPAGGGADVDHRHCPDHSGEHAERDALRIELAKLPRLQRAVVVLRYYEDLPDSEIAEIIGCKPVTVRGYASRALAALRVEMTTVPGPPAEHRAAGQRGRAELKIEGAGR